jgi:hypothetical protein
MEDGGLFGDGNLIGFWKEKWLGTVPLRDLFPSLFAKSTQPCDFISNMGS